MRGSRNAAYKSRVNELAISNRFIRRVYPRSLSRKTRGAYYWLILLRSLFMAGQERALRRAASV